MRSSHLLAVVLLVAGCGGESPVAATSVCAAPPTQPGVTGCAILTGYATDLQDRILDGLEGSLRPSASCACSTQTLQFDERGVFSTTVYRTGAAQAPDTATVTAVLLAVAAKYPRHSTGAPYFDTLSVVLRFVPIGRSPEPRDVRLRIPIPTGGP